MDGSPDDVSARLPLPGAVLVYEPTLRRPPRRRTPPPPPPEEEEEKEEEEKGDRADLVPLRLVQWNIERGYEMGKVLEILAALDADAVALQEVDIGCKRSGGDNQAKILAEKLGMTCAFVCEFREIEHEMRAERDQGGGVHGNAVLTRYPARFRVIDHLHHPYDWESDGHQIREPRKGRRFTLVADVEPDDGHPPFQLYSAHLEVFCGLSGRVAQISDLLHDAATHPAPSSSSSPSSSRVDPVAPPPPSRQALFGDLNTGAHGIARLSSRYCRDAFRWRTLGTSESRWVDEHVFAVHVLEGERNGRLERLGLPDLIPDVVLRHARNPGFVDPWHPSEDVTLRGRRSYLRLYRAKLDWTLLRGFDVVAQRAGNDDYAASDHKYLLVDVVPSSPRDGATAAADRMIREEALDVVGGGSAAAAAIEGEEIRAAVLAEFRRRRLATVRRRRRLLDKEGGLLVTPGAQLAVLGAAVAAIGIGLWFWQRKSK